MSLLSIEGQDRRLRRRFSILSLKSQLFTHSWFVGEYGKFSSNLVRSDQLHANLLL